MILCELRKTLGGVPRSRLNPKNRKIPCLGRADHGIPLSQTHRSQAGSAERSLKPRRVLPQLRPTRCVSEPYCVRPAARTGMSPNPSLNELGTTTVPPVSRTLSYSRCIERNRNAASLPS